jgi:hypothetical protein
MDLLSVLKDLGFGTLVALFLLFAFVFNKIWCLCFDPIFEWQSSDDDCGSDGGGGD